MKKIKTVKHTKLWGYEIWLYSPVPGMETTFEDGTKNQGGPLVKIIKANKPLSVQVHPDDKFAQELENQPNGKSESWYVVDHEQGAELVMGINHFDEKVIREKLSNRTFKEELKMVKVNKGDFFNIPAGLIHGIGAGNTIFEVQQPSDVTYRYYDYDRLENGKPRELHVDKAIKVQKDLDWKLSPTSREPLTYKNTVGTQIFMKKPTTLKSESLIFDLNLFEAYIAEAGEEIKFENYAIVSLGNVNA